MRNFVTKITLFIILGGILWSCNAVKRVPNEKQLLVSNEILIDNKKSSNDTISGLLLQKPNTSVIGMRFGLYLYNFANPNPEASYQAKFIKNPKKYTRLSKLLSKKQVDRLGKSFWYYGIHKFLKETGDAPVILDEENTKKSIARIQSHYFNKGYFNNKVTSKTETIGKKRAKVSYLIQTGNHYNVDSIHLNIQSPKLDSLYKSAKNLSYIKKGKSYLKSDFDAERNRITTHFRNNGAYFFQQNYISYNLDTINTKSKVNVDLNIKKQSVKEGDSIKQIAFETYKISKVNIFASTKNTKIEGKIVDSVQYHDFNIYSTTKLKYKPKSITNAIFITKGSLFSDINTSLTSRYLSNLKIFNYPSIQYTLDPSDQEGRSLIANIYVNSRSKFGFNNDLSVTHSNIQSFGIAGNSSISIRNVFNGAETLEFLVRGSIGSSKDLANPDNVFFNVSEYGADLKLNIPRFWFPILPDKIIPSKMIPNTSLSVGFTKQNNIGLDKENFISTMNYSWTPQKNTTCRFDLFNIQYVKNLNTRNYFNVYKSSYQSLNNIANTPNYNVDAGYFDGNRNLLIEYGTQEFINKTLSTNTYILSSSDLNSVRSIEERRKRLTENNLISSSSFTFSESSRTDLNDHTFYSFKTKLEAAGNVLSLIANTSKSLDSQEATNTIFQIEYSQYFKTEFDYVKHWALGKKSSIAIRQFAGIAIPYGNSKNIPFSRSYFAGGSNDNRAWQPYSLGAGSTGALNDFNEANLKIAFSAEYRFKIVAALNGALFIDAGNIWNVFDDINDEKAKFTGFQSILDTAVGTGFGLRYDFDFFVVRLDLGFKTFNPADNETKKWFSDYNFNRSVINIGINYPF